ncbi:hypothetical protein AJ78_08483 [Emergomyces pasteurianus Ep9510]|uniref:Uncharacterized protein n=1 Tax=Emergomyces pasteurianus Ep9510 TaxID=1447872 RepID=A0A1J9P2E3_9EURO|nr:hypothetical protein AJ78_08483 [Emergomyces pasteurianus Ep9510]
MLSSTRDLRRSGLLQAGLPGFPSNTCVDHLQCNNALQLKITALPDAYFSRHMYSSSSSEISLAFEPGESFREDSSNMDMGKYRISRPAQSAILLPGLAVRSLAIVVACWLSLKLINNAYTLVDFVRSLSRPFMPSPEVANHLVEANSLTTTVNSDNAVALVAALKSCECVIGSMAEPAASPIYTDSTVMCDAQPSTPAMVTVLQLEENPHTVEFHPVVGVAINSNATSVERVNNEPSLTFELPGSAPAVRTPQLMALVLLSLVDGSAPQISRTQFPTLKHRKPQKAKKPNNGGKELRTSA